MKIIHSRPPNFAEILAVFPMAANPGIVFAFNDAVFIPNGQELPLWLAAHEQVHLDRQGQNEASARAWWAKYLVDIEFRYHEELLAHRAEYYYQISQNRSRPFRRKILKETAKRLASPLYGRMRSVNQCQDDILAGQ